MNKPVDKDSLQLNQPKRTPGHPTKSHIVKTKVDGKEKIIRFGQQGASTAGKPKEGESDRMTAKRDSFKARHSANIAKGPSSAAYWANKVKWADGGSVRTNYAEGDSVQATPQQPVLGSIANFLKKSYAPQRTQQAQGIAEFLGIPALARTIESKSYGYPITNYGVANVPLIPSDTAEAAMAVAEAVPVVGPLAKVARKSALKGAKVVGEELNRAILDNSGALARFVPEAAKPMYAVKPKGGNWLSGSIEKSIKPLKLPVRAPDFLARIADDEARGLTQPGMLESVLQQNSKAQTMNKWVDQKLGKYIKNEMGTPEDPVRDLAERGITHAFIQPTRYNVIGSIRKKAGFPEEGFGVSPQARSWESRSDSLINKLKASDLTPQSYSEALIENPWLLKVPPETPVYNLRSDSGRELGFSHLIDELRNAIDPESTLPANLRLTSKQLNDVTMPQAVERVSKINDWRAAQAAEAEKAGMLDNLTVAPRLQDPTAQLSFVEKPGMTWVDIPATTDDKANKLCTTIGKQAGWCTQGDDLATFYGSGSNRLTTLLDAEGRPHAQAKISRRSDSAYWSNDDAEEVMQIMSAAERRKFNNFLGSDDFYGEQEEALEWLQSNMPKVYENYVTSAGGPPSIGEIKPVGNDFSSKRALEYEKRDPQYRAKITDSVVKFLNSGEWSTVKDLDIYDIVDLRDPSRVQKMLKDVLDYDLPNERVDKFNKAVELNPEANRFMSLSQFKEFVDPDLSKEGFAKGGSVTTYDPDQVDAIANQYM